MGAQLRRNQNTLMITGAGVIMAITPEFGYPLIVCHAFAGFVDIMRSRESKQLNSPNWKMSMMRGIINILIAASCAISIGWPQYVVYVYAAGLAYSGISQILASFRKTAIVYIQ